jgi:hypothetical protein
VKKDREDTKKRWEAAKAASLDSVSIAPPASDANPKHREDFNSLVNAAAQKREQED